MLRKILKNIFDMFIVDEILSYDAHSRVMNDIRNRKLKEYVILTINDHIYIEVDDELWTFFYCGNYFNLNFQYFSQYFK